MRLFRLEIEQHAVNCRVNDIGGKRTCAHEHPEPDHKHFKSGD